MIFNVILIMIFFSIIIGLPIIIIKKKQTRWTGIITEYYTDAALARLLTLLPLQLVRFFVLFNKNKKKMKTKRSDEGKRKKGEERSYWLALRFALKANNLCNPMLAERSLMRFS